MYYILCAAASKALDELPQNVQNLRGKQLLQDALFEAEDLYLREETDETGAR